MDVRITHGRHTKETDSTAVRRQSTTGTVCARAGINTDMLHKLPAPVLTALNGVHIAAEEDNPSLNTVLSYFKDCLMVY